MKKKIISLLLAGILALSVSVPALAAEFTPSVENKKAPEVEIQKDSTGADCAAIITEADKNEIAVPTGKLTVTPVSAVEEAPAEVKETLNAAYQQLQTVASLTELSPDLEPALKKQDLTTDKVVVRDLFDVSVTGQYADSLKKDGASIKITFKLSTDSKNLAAVLHNVKGNEWETIPEGRIARKDDTVTVTFNSLSPVAFLFDETKLDVKPGGPDSPQTGEPDSYAVWFAVGGVIVLAAAACVVGKKRSFQNV